MRKIPRLRRDCYGVETLSFQKLIDAHSPKFDGLEIYVTESTSRKVQVKEGEVENTAIRENSNVYARVIKDGRVLTMRTNASDEAGLTDFLSGADGVIGLMPADEFNVLPANSDALEIDLELYDEDIANISDETIMQTAFDIEKSALSADSRVDSVKQASFAVGATSISLFSSLSAPRSYSQTSCTGVAYALAKQDGETQDGYGWDALRKLSKLDVGKIGVEAAETAVSLLGAKKAKTGEYHILFDRDIMADFLGLIFSMVSGDNVYKKMSMLEGKLGEKVASPLFNISDNPLLKGAIGSTPFDDEGVEASVTEVIKDGVLQSYLHNTYTAGVLGMTNTGNGSRDGGGNIGVGSTNFIMQPGTDHDISSYGDVLKVTEVMGMHTANPVSGEFSVGISGVIISGGQKSGAFKECVLTGNLKDLLNQAVHVFDNSRSHGGVICPDVLFDKLSVSGA
jgi:PmbA protein